VKLRDQWTAGNLDPFSRSPNLITSPLTPAQTQVKMVCVFQTKKRKLTRVANN
jgi:hypothetical protein